MKLKEYKWKRCELKRDYKNEFLNPDDYLFMSDHKCAWVSIGIYGRGLNCNYNLRALKFRQKFNPNLNPNLKPDKEGPDQDKQCKDKYWNYKQKDLLELIFNNYKMEDLVEGLLYKHKVAMWLRNHGHL